MDEKVCGWKLLAQNEREKYSYFKYENVKVAINDYKILLNLYETQQMPTNEEYRYFVENYFIFINFGNDSLEDYYKIIFGNFEKTNILISTCCNSSVTLFGNEGARCNHCGKTCGVK